MLSEEEIKKAKRVLRPLSVGDFITWLTTDGIIEVELAIKIILKYIDQLEQSNQKLIEKLENDVVNITKTLQDGKHSDDYSRCRLKAYRTKTKEILSLLKGEKKWVKH